MVKSEPRRDTEILVRNPSLRLFGKKFRDSKKVKTNHAKTRLRDLSKTLLRFQDPAKIFQDPRFSRYHLPPLIRPVYLDGFYSGLFSLKSCSLSVLINLSFSCSTIIRKSLGCHSQVSERFLDIGVYRFAITDNFYRHRFPRFSYIQ